MRLCLVSSFCVLVCHCCVFLFKQKTAYELRISDWSSDVCSSDLLIETVHKIGTRSKRKVVGDIAKDIERVYGKERLLVEIASASINESSGRICDAIFPIAGKAKLAAIVKESHAKGALDRRIYKVKIGRAQCRERVCQSV